MSNGRNMLRKRRVIPAALAAASLALGAPHVGLALPGSATALSDQTSELFRPFTPATVDPQLAQRVAQSLGGEGMRFTPAVGSHRKDRTVTVAVRVDDATARAMSVRSAIDSVRQQPGSGTDRIGSLAIASTKYNLGIARGYQGFAKKPALPDTVSDIAMPDLAQIKADKDANKKPSRFQPRIALEQDREPGRAPGTLEGLGEQSVDVSGAYRVTRNLDVTAGVRLSQDRDRIAPLTDSVEDSQAVYVGTQLRF